MRIALIYPATRVDKRVSADSLPMGILYLAAALEKNLGIQVDVYDARHGPDFPAPAILSDYDAMGFSVMTMQARHALSLTRKARRHGYKGPILFGGPHASVAPEHLMAQTFINAVFIGEAEETLPEYLRYLQGKKHQLQRVWIRTSDGDWKYHLGDRFIKDLDVLPFPAREKYDGFMRKTTHVNLSTGRGCPFQCHYCQPTKDILFGKRVRRRTPANVVSELNDVIQKYGVTDFTIDDDTFTFHKRTVLEFCEVAGPLGLNWHCQSRTDIDRETLEAMKDAGCKTVIIGVESGSQRMLDIMNKKNTVEKNELFIRNCHELGIKTWCNMMVGYPGETEEDMKMSLEFVRRTQPTGTNVNQVTPFPGTYLWEKHKDDIIHPNWNHIARHVHRAKFKSLASRQTLIKCYITLMNKRWEQPVSADLVRFPPFLWYLCRRVPYLLRILVHREHARQASLQKGIELARAGKIDQGINRLKKLTRPYSTRAYALGNIGWLYLSTGRPRQAIIMYERLLSLQPQNPELRYLLARAYRETGEKEEAVKQIKECLALDPDYPSAREDLEALERGEG